MITHIKHSKFSNSVTLTFSTPEEMFKFYDSISTKLDIIVKKLASKTADEGKQNDSKRNNSRKKV